MSRLTTPPTMRDVATLAGVGVKTVSRVMNDEPGVTEATRDRVLRAATELRYQLNLAAGSLRRSGATTRSVGLLVPSVSNPFSGEVHRAVEDALAPDGIAVFASSLDEDPAREEVAVAAFLQRRVDGLLLSTIRPDQGYLAPYLSQGFPMVFIDRRPTGLVADVVSGDSRSGAAMVADHLIDRGHRRLLMLADNPAISTAAERRDAFVERCLERGLAAEELRVVDSVVGQHAAAATIEAEFRRSPAPTAVFAGQNLITWGAIRGLRRLGLQHRVALVGYDDFDLSDLLEPAVSTVQQQPRTLGRLAADRLLSRMRGDSAPAETLLIPPRLIQRGSGEIPPLDEE